MQPALEPPLISRPGSRHVDRILARPLLLVLWVAALGLLLIAPGGVPVSRTQEARVLETARQMMASDAPHPYLVPVLNGQYRLQKPPLAYWLAVGGYKVFGVSAAVGRLPAILAGWGTLGFTYLAGAWLFNRRTGLLAAAALLSSYLFYRYTRLAETDTLATVFVTGSCLLFWRATRAKSGWVGWFHAAAAMAAGAALAKGPPAVFPILFFVALCLVNKDWTSLKRFFLSGCLVTLVVIAGAWYAYLASNGLLKQIYNEIDDLAAGHDHGGTFLNYLPELLTSTAPWSGLFVAALVFGVQQFKRDDRIRGLAIWFLAILVPLCCIGNKQFHYLFPLMPPAMLLVAALCDHVLSLRPDDPAAKPVVAIFLGTLAVTACAAVALPVTSWYLLHRVVSTDFLLGALVAVASVIVFFAYLKHGFSGGLPAYARAAAVLMPLILSLWLPPLVTDDFPAFAAQLRARFGAGPYVFYKQVPKLPLNFELRAPAAYARTPAGLRAVVEADPDTIALFAVKHDADAPPTPPGFVTALTLDGRENDLYVFRAAAGDPAH